MILINLWTQTDFGGMFKIIQVYERYDGANKMQIEQHWVIPQTVPYLVQRNWKQQELRRSNRTWKMAKWDFAWILTLERKWKTRGWMPKKFVKGRLNFSCKSTTAAKVDLTESLLDNWLKNNHITVNEIYYLRSLFVFFYEFQFSNLFLNRRKPAQKQNPVAFR